MEKKNRKLQTPRGTSDILPDDQVYWEWVKKIAIETASIFGHSRIDTPMFEDTSLFLRTVGEGTDIVEKEMYTFQDRGKDSLTLRPEGTAPVARAYIEHGMHSLPQPVKFYYITPIFRYERPQAGRFRQHWQFGIETIGDDSSQLDSEVIHLLWTFLLKTGISGIRLLINSIGDDNCRPEYLRLLKSHYETKLDDLCAECKIRFNKNPLRLLDCKQEGCQLTKATSPKILDYLCHECETHFERVKETLTLWNIPYTVTPELVRGLDYYTKTVFEIHPGSEGSQTALGAGGRYDGLIEKIGGKPTPAVGFGSGIERIILTLKSLNFIPEEQKLSKDSIYIAYIGIPAYEKMLSVINHLRNSGITVYASTKPRSLKAQLRSANNSSAARTLIIGEDELSSNKGKLLDMQSNITTEIPLDNLVELLTLNT